MAGDLQVSGVLNFGAVAVGASVAGTFRITNAGALEATVAITYPYDNPFGPNVVGPATSARVPAGGSVDIPVAFQPLQTDSTFGIPIREYYGLRAEVRSQSHLVGSVPAPGAVGYTTGSRLIDVTPLLDFGTTAAGGSQAKTLRIRNVGAEVLAITGIVYPTGFTGPNWTGVIPPGAVQDIAVTFSPGAPLLYSGAIRVSATSRTPRRRHGKPTGTDASGRISRWPLGPAPRPRPALSPSAASSTSDSSCGVARQ
jgi:hypothetical protein